MVSISPVGLAGTALVANQLSALVTIKEKLCKPYCVNGTLQPQSNVIYTYGTPSLVDSAVFIPVVATVTIVTPNGKCNATTHLYTETFTVAFQGQTELPTSVAITSVGRQSFGTDVSCCKASSYAIEDSITVVIN